METMNYSELTTTTEAGAVCVSPCADYKGMVDCILCGATFCITCADGCESCGAGIVWSA